MGYHILVVDDEEMIRKLISKYAVYEGHTVTEAKDGMEAVRLCREGSFDIMIIDIMMPEPVSYTHLDVYKRQGVIRSSTPSLSAM